MRVFRSKNDGSFNFKQSNIILQLTLIWDFVDIHKLLWFEHLLFENVLSNESFKNIPIYIFPRLRKLEDQWMVNLGSLASLDPVNGCNSKDDAKASARTSGS